MSFTPTPAEDRAISLGSNLPPIPERLLLAHARGEVIFICGAGVSQPAKLPDFRTLVLDVYKTLDSAAYSALLSIPRNACNRWDAADPNLTNQQQAEVRRFINGDYDVVLGMLERRLDNESSVSSRVRNEVTKRLRSGSTGPASIHRALMRLSNRGNATTIVTTNFDLLLEAAQTRGSTRVQSYSLGAIPRPSRRTEFAGVLHIHGAISKNEQQFSELVLSDQDFGEFYLRRRVIPDFIYDAARLFNLVLVGYSANDPPMRYLLNAVAADGTRFDDLRERFTFFGTQTPDQVALEDWRSRGITPICYNSNHDHSLLSETLAKWAKLSAINGTVGAVDSDVRRIVKSKRGTARDEDRDRFDHFFRRSNTSERRRLAEVASAARADHSWLDAMAQIEREMERGPRQ